MLSQPRSSRTFTAWADVPDTDWDDWHWQFRASATNAWLLVRIAQRQQARYEEDPVPVVVQPPPPVGPATAWWPAAPTVAAPPSGPAAMAPGWYADPSARFTWRWWDGRAWTAHVQRNGLDAHDPPPG